MSALAIIMAVGSGLDLVRAYSVRQQMSAAAELTCQYANRPSVVMLAFGSGGLSSYKTSVNNYYALAQGYQNANWTQTTPFSATLGGSGTVNLTASVATTIMKLIGATSLPVSVSLQCFSILGGGPQQPAADATATMLVNEGFENSWHNIAYYHPNGTYTAWESGTTIPLVSTVPTNPGFVGSFGNEWVIMGYCLETDVVGNLISPEPDGSSFNAQLDCDNGHATAGSSSISTKVYMVAGTYELRYYYAGYGNDSLYLANNYYGSSYICGTTAADTSWATDTSYAGGQGTQTDQINVYLDQNTTGSPPTHTTIVDGQTLAGSNLIDECVYSDGWIERSVPITVTTSAYYWLSFAADGTNDSFGGLLDDIRLCKNTCSGSVNDNFPTSWLPSGSNNVLLFEDNFESPTYTHESGTIYYNTSGNPGTSHGSSTVWDVTGQGWGNWTLDQLPYWLSACPQGNQCIQIGWHDTANNTDVAIARPFLLVPGYYEIDYDYISENLFPSLTTAHPRTVYCGVTPSDAGISVLTGGSGAGIDRTNGVNHGTLAWSSGTVGVFMAHAQMASEPNPSTTLGSTTTYTNADGTVTSSPTYASNTISLTSYDSTQANPLLDICGYAGTKQVRTAYIFIEKPALYWLVFSILGTYDAFGAMIDDVKITALGSPYMSGAPSSPVPVTIPVPNPQPGGTITYTGFTITSKPY